MARLNSRRSYNLVDGAGDANFIELCIENTFADALLRGDVSVIACRASQLIWLRTQLWALIYATWNGGSERIRHFLASSKFSQLSPLQLPLHCRNRTRTKAEMTKFHTALSGNYVPEPPCTTCVLLILTVLPAFCWTLEIKIPLIVFNWTQGSADGFALIFFTVIFQNSASAGIFWVLLFNRRNARRAEVVTSSHISSFSSSSSFRLVIVAYECDDIMLFFIVFIV